MLTISVNSANTTLSFDPVSDLTRSSCNWLTHCLHSVGLVRLIDRSGQMGLIEDGYSDRKKNQNPHKINKEFAFSPGLTLGDQDSPVWHWNCVCQVTVIWKHQCLRAPVSLPNTIASWKQSNIPSNSAKRPLKKTKSGDVTKQTSQSFPKHGNYIRQEILVGCRTKTLKMLGLCMSAIQRFNSLKLPKIRCLLGSSPLKAVRSGKEEATVGRHMGDKINGFLVWLENIWALSIGLDAVTVHHLKHIKVTMKHGHGSVRLWGRLSAAGLGRLVKLEKYHQILEDNLI